MFQSALHLRWTPPPKRAFARGAPGAQRVFERSCSASFLFMQRVTVTFDLVFDLRRSAGSIWQTRVTHFSFKAGSQVQRGLTVPGWPRLQVGDTVTALLRRPGDWSTLVGWVNHNNGEVAAATGERTLRRAGLLALAAGALAVLLWGVLTIDNTAMSRSLRLWSWLPLAGYGVFLVLLTGVVLVRRGRHRRTAQELADCLIEVRSSMMLPEPDADAAVPPPRRANG